LSSLIHRHRIPGPGPGTGLDLCHLGCRSAAHRLRLEFSRFPRGSLVQHQQYR